MSGVYERLRAHLDSLPAGFPATAEGIELRLLKRLFTPQEATLACHVSMSLQTSEQIAAKAGLEFEKTAARLAEMSRKGLIFSEEFLNRRAISPTSARVSSTSSYISTPQSC